jgi:hypothetical protein
LNFPFIKIYRVDHLKFHELIDHPYETQQVNQKLDYKMENDTELKEKINNSTNDTKKKIIKEEKKEI